MKWILVSYEIFNVESKSRPGTWYEVNFIKNECTCESGTMEYSRKPENKKGIICHHLKFCLGLFSKETLEILRVRSTLLN